MSMFSKLEECVGQLDEPFRRSEIVGWFRRHHPEVKESTLGVFIQGATENAANRAQNQPHLSTRPALLRRVGHGLYVRAGGVAAGASSETAVESRTHAPPGGTAGVRPQAAGSRPEEPTEAGEAGSAARGDVVLIGCVRTKHPVASPAADLFNSPLFTGRRGYAARAGKPWYILSAKYGLLAPDDVIGPYDVYLADQSPAYRRAWGEFVVAQLSQLEPSLRNLVIEVHAGAAYVEPLRRPLTAQGATLATPLSHLALGEQIAWYRSHPSSPLTPMPASGPLDRPAPRTSPPQLPALVAELIVALTDRAQAMSPAELLSLDPDVLAQPGLYTWWVDGQGAADLSAGLHAEVAPGLIYAGSAGATHWPSGKRSGNTLRGRLQSMHLGGSAEFSTFRRSLAAVLRLVLGLDSEDDPGLSVWMHAHLKVIAVPVPDADRLGRIETAVLGELDPPLNLAGRPRSPLRQRLSQLRRQRGA